ncbi:MAG TPA: hypothetical protein VI790_02415 [Candidatus Nanoarchaeia archaeon]|nr:hypothetical protein [Candidatus Nanoarchaeia archaeon]
MKDNLADFLVAVKSANLIKTDDNNYTSKFIALNSDYNLFELCSERYNDANYVGGREVITYLFKADNFAPVIESLITNQNAKCLLNCVKIHDIGSWDHENFYYEDNCRVEVQTGIVECELKINELRLEYTTKFTPQGITLIKESEINRTLNKDTLKDMIKTAIKKI